MKTDIDFFFKALGRPLNSHEGSVLTQILVLLPILLSALLGLTTFLYSLKIWKEEYHLCRTEAIQLQQELSTSLSQILRLNVLARSLQIAETTAKVVLAAAITSMNPKAIIAATKALRKIESKQKLLGLKQKAWIQRGRLFLIKRQLKLRTTIAARHSPLSAESLRIKSPSPLAISPAKPHPRAPVYRLQEPFLELQSIQLRWQANLLSRLNPEISGLHSMQDHGEFSFRITCKATLQKQEQRWIPRLMNTAKPLLN